MIVIIKRIEETIFKIIQWLVDTLYIAQIVMIYQQLNLIDIIQRQW